MVRLLLIVLMLGLPSLASKATGAVAKVSAASGSSNIRAALRPLEPNQAIALGTARVTGELNDVAREFGLDRTGPQGRDFSIKMVWAPERKRSLFLGANHGRPHRLNDVWEFDLGTMTWSLLYAPDNSRSYGGLGKDPSDVRFQGGVLVSERGGPAVIGHTWWGITYDVKNRRTLFMNTWATDQVKAIQQLGGDPNARYRGAPLWSFDPAKKRWDSIQTPALSPRAPFAGLLEYVPDLGGAIWHSNHWQMRATWLYRDSENAWTKLAGESTQADFQSVAPLQEQVGYYDPRRKILVVHRGSRTSHFDIASRKWHKVIDAPEDSPTNPAGHDAHTPFHYDPASGHGLLVDFRSNAMWAYDPDARSWTRLAPKGDPMPKGRKRLAYMDPEFNVFVVIDAVEVWAYRYR